MTDHCPITTTTTAATARGLTKTVRRHRPRRRGARPARHRPRPARRPLHRDHGAVRLRQVHPHALPRRARHAHGGRGDRGRTAPGRAHRRRPHPFPPRPRRLRVPVVQPAADADCRAEHLVAHRAGRCPTRRPDRPCSTRSSTRSGSATGWPTGPAELSGGQQQRVAVARALVSRPGDHLRRRADRQPRQCRVRRGARLPAPLRARARSDGRDGHPRARARRRTPTTSSSSPTGGSPRASPTRRRTRWSPP